ncbi:MAG: winged helix-turn-helix transcriptional regulator [Clostridium sp.]|nr:winged helix-turn-helix transcriptional regulator [Clostridium sp.]
MDKIDTKILNCLKKNSRIKASAISKEIHLSVSAVIERIHKMENNGVIKNYTIIVDECKLGKGIGALMEVSLDHPKYYDSFTYIFTW